MTILSSKEYTQASEMLDMLESGFRAKTPEWLLDAKECEEYADVCRTIRRILLDKYADCLELVDFLKKEGVI